MAAPSPNLETDSEVQRARWVSEPRVRDALRRYFARRAPEVDVDDLVQQTLADALTARNAPSLKSEWDQWVYGIARHKVADLHRGRKRELPLEAASHAPAESAPQSARELLRWAERELPEGEHAHATLEALLEEADGESLENLARANSLPPARLRQRATRLRRHFRERWALYLALLGSVASGLVIWIENRHEVVDIIVEPPLPPLSPVADQMRRIGLEKCARGEYDECLRNLDAAKQLDPAGDVAKDVVEARAAAARAKSVVPAPAPPAVPSSVPFQKAKPSPRPTATTPPTPSPTPAPTAMHSGSTPARPRAPKASSIDSK